MKHTTILVGILIVVACLGGCVKKSQPGMTLPSAATIDEALSMKTTDALIAVFGLIDKKVQADSFASLSHPEQVVYAISLLEMEVNNGGFHQYFFNSSGDYTNEALAGLQEIGASKTAELLKQACAVFPDVSALYDRAKRTDQLDQIGEEGESTLHELDEKFYALTENVDTLLIKFIKSHKQDFK